LELILKKLLILVLVLTMSAAFAKRNQSKPAQQGIRATPMQKQQGEPNDKDPAPQDHNEQAWGYRK
jgi:hypothetical protein